MPSEDITGDVLAATASWTAAVRALEHGRPDRLFEDPWAALLAGETGSAWIAGRPPESVLPIVLRTRFFDDVLKRIASERPVRQIVLLAAGYDTRTFRLEWPEGMHVYELDQPAVLDRKERVLAQAGATLTCARHAVGTDLTSAWEEKLLASGFDSGAPSGWLLEGFLFYISSAAAAGILDTVSGLASPGSLLCCDVINTSMLTSPLTRAWIEMQAKQGAPWIGTMDDPEKFLGERGWKATLTQAGQPDANHGRWMYPVVPVRMPDIPHNWFVTAVKHS